MKKLAYIFSITIFFCGCGPSSKIINVSYNPIDHPRQVFTLKDKQPVLYIDSVTDNREFAVGKEVLAGFAFVKSGRFEEDPTLALQLEKIVRIGMRLRVLQQLEI